MARHDDRALKGKHCDRHPSPRCRRAATPVFMLLAVALAGLATASAAVAAVPGTQLWLRTYIQPGSTSLWRSLAVRPDGGVYTVGDHRRTGGDGLLLSRYDAGGARRWDATWHGMKTAEARQVAIAPAGGAYVTCVASSSLPGSDIAVLRYSAAGKHLWTKRYAGPTGQDNYSTGLVTDDSGNVYVVGYSRDASGNHYGVVILKISASGALRWVQRIDADPADPQSGHVMGVDIALDGDLNVYVAVNSEHGGTNSAFVAKFAGLDGAPLARSGGVVIVGTDTMATALAIRGGEVVLAGWVSAWDSNSAGDWEMLVERFDTNLHWEWSVTAKGTGNGAGANMNECRDVAVDAAGNVYAVGMTFDQVGAEAKSRATLLKVTPGGALAWKRTYKPGTANASAAELVAATGGHVYVEGASGDGWTLDTPFTLGYTADGLREWVKPWPGHGPARGNSYALGLGPRCVYAAGNRGGSAPVAVLIKYAR